MLRNLYTSDKPDRSSNYYRKQEREEEGRLKIYYKTALYKEV
jgi:hypothetical protein